MNKTELIAAAAKECGMTQQDVYRALGGILTTIEKTVANGEKVQMVGFGTFEGRFRAGRSVRNPKTGEVVPLNHEQKQVNPYGTIHWGRLGIESSYYANYTGNRRAKQ